MSDFATVHLKSGGSYETPVDNLENVRRMLSGKYNRIVLPGEQDEDSEQEETETPKRGRKKKQTN